jgi:hypothetical protein
MGIKERFSKKTKTDNITKEDVKKELHTEYQEDKKQMVGHAKRIKTLWRSKEVVQLKTEAIVVLWKKKGYETIFFEEFDRITKEGYQMVLMEGVKALDAGPLDIKIGNYYYFQHRNFIK